MTLTNHPPALLDVQQVRKHYGEHHVNALQGVSLQLCPGELVALMGPSGCGKSTLLNILGTLEVPNSGQVLMDGVPVFQNTEQQLTRFRRDSLGFIFQFFNLLSTLTVAENIALPLALNPDLKKQERETAVAAMMDRVGMTHRANFYPAQLSGGEMQRTAVARALVHQPRLILADEPTGNLDTENGEAVLRLLREIATANGPAILMATHSEEAARYADRIIRMRDGRICDG